VHSLILDIVIGDFAVLAGITYKLIIQIATPWEFNFTNDLPSNDT
jgi:hypothetical protein